MTRRTLAQIVALIGWLALPASAEPWSEKLGFPAGSRVVVIDVGEIGVSWEFNLAGQKLLESGRASSASVVVTGPWAQDFADWSQANPGHDVGVSIALTNPYRAISWRLLSSEFGPSTLVDADGLPWKNVVQFATNATPEDVKSELDAQINRARQLGLPVTHLGSYYGTLLSRHDLAGVFLASSQKYWLPAPVVDLTPELIERFRRQGYPVDPELITMIASYPLPKLDDLQLLPAGESYEQTRDRLCELIAVLPPGLTQLISRPAVESEGMKRMTPDWQHRVWAWQALNDDKVLETMAEQKIIVTNWREIMQRFESPVSLNADQPQTETTETTEPVRE